VRVAEPKLPSRESLVLIATVAKSIKNVAAAPLGSELSEQYSWMVARDARHGLHAKENE